MAIATDPSQNRNSVGRETTNKVVYESGLYRHPETGAEIGALEDPLFGNAQAEAVGRAGFKRVGDLPEGYVKDISPEYATVGATSGSLEDLKGIQARMTLLENERAELLAKQATENMTDHEKKNAAGLTASQAHEEAARADAEAEIARRYPDLVGDPLSNDAPAKPLDKMNKTELLAQAEADGVTVDPAMTNKQLKEAIKSAQ